MGFWIFRIAPIVFRSSCVKGAVPGFELGSGTRSLRNLKSVCVGPVPALGSTNLRLILIDAESHLDCRAATSCRNTPPRDALAPYRDPACHEKTKGKRRALQTRTPADQGPDKRCQDTTDPAGRSEFTAIFRPLFRLPIEKRETKSEVNAESV